MNYEQVLAWIELYGQGAFYAVLTIGVIIFGLVALVKFWPLLTKMVAIGTAWATQPETNKKAEEASARHEVKIDEVISRLGSVEARTGSIEAKVSEIRHEVFPNGGGSMRDDLNNMSADVKKNSRQLGTLSARVGRAEKTIKSVTEK